MQPCVTRRLTSLESMMALTTQSGGAKTSSDWATENWKRFMLNYFHLFWEPSSPYEATKSNSQYIDCNERYDLNVL